MFLAETSIPYLGEAFALLAALNWAFALVLFKLSGESVPPLSLCLFKNIVGIICLFGTMLLSGVDGSAVAELSWSDVCLLAVSGILGIAIADTLLFYSLNIVGVGLVTIVECTYTPSVVLCAWLMLSERLTIPDCIGGLLIISAVVLVTGHKPSHERTRIQLIGGLACGALAITLMAFGIVLVKPIIEGAPLIPVTLIRLLAGTVVMIGPMAASRSRRVWLGVLYPSAVWKTSFPAAFFGSYLAMLFWIGGFKYTSAAVAAILNQTSTIMALVCARIILKETLTCRKIIAGLLALVGILVVTSGEKLVRSISGAQ